jgi:DNA-binding PadR family transcriptional regulator
MAISDKRSRRDLDLFLLALLRQDVNTPYRLVATARLSPGATIPALRRLEKAGLARRGRAGARGRAEYVITVAGRRHLESEWRSLLDPTASADIEAIFRTATLAVLCGAEKRTVSSYLRKAASARSAAAKIRNSEAKAIDSHSGVSLYAWLLATHAAARSTMETKLLRRSAAMLPQRI